MSNASAEGGEDGSASRSHRVKSGHVMGLSRRSPEPTRDPGREALTSRTRSYRNVPEETRRPLAPASSLSHSRIFVLFLPLYACIYIYVRAFFFVSLLPFPIFSSSGPSPPVLFPRRRCRERDLIYGTILMPKNTAGLGSATTTRTILRCRNSKVERRLPGRARLTATTRYKKSI